LAGSYAQWWGEAQQLLAGLDTKSQAAVMGSNAARLYRLDPP